MRHKCYICYENDLPDEQHYHPRCSKMVFGTEEAPQMPYALDELKDLARLIVRSQRVVTGVQPKISLGIEKSKKRIGRLTFLGNSHILKPPSERFDQLPEVEDLTMSLAEFTGIETVPHALIKLKSGELAYITKRVDRSGKRKIHMEDFCQLSQLSTENKYKSSMEKVGRVVATYSDDFGLDLFNLYMLTLFCFLTGNNDMHLKNFSLIKRRNLWVMAPAYDLLNVSLVFPEDIEETALTISGRKRKLRRENFISLGQSYHLSDKQIENAFSMVCEKDLDPVINKSFLSAENKKLYSNLIKYRKKILQGVS